MKEKYTRWKIMKTDENQVKRDKNKKKGVIQGDEDVKRRRIVVERWRNWNGKENGEEQMKGEIEKGNRDEK